MSVRGPDAVFPSNHVARNRRLRVTGVRLSFGGLHLSRTVKTGFQQVKKRYHLGDLAILLKAKDQEPAQVRLFPTRMSRDCSTTRLLSSDAQFRSTTPGVTC